MAKRTNNTTTENNGLVVGAAVNATVKGGEVYVGTIKATAKGGFVIEFGDGSTLTLPRKAIELRKRGRKSIVQSMTPDEIKAEVKGLLEELGECEDGEEKKRLRRLLRRRGHRGALGVRPVTVKSINA